MVCEHIMQFLSDGSIRLFAVALCTVSHTDTVHKVLTFLCALTHQCEHHSLERFTEREPCIKLFSAIRCLAEEHAFLRFSSAPLVATENAFSTVLVWLVLVACFLMITMVYSFASRCNVDKLLSAGNVHQQPMACIERYEQMHTIHREQSLVLLGNAHNFTKLIVLYRPQIQYSLPKQNFHPDRCALLYLVSFDLT